MSSVDFDKPIEWETVGRVNEGKPGRIRVTCHSAAKVEKRDKEGKPFHVIKTGLKLVENGAGPVTQPEEFDFEFSTKFLDSWRNFYETVTSRKAGKQSINQMLPHVLGGSSWATLAFKEGGWPKLTYFSKAK